MCVDCACHASNHRHGQNIHIYTVENHVESVLGMMIMDIFLADCMLLDIDPCMLYYHILSYFNVNLVDTFYPESTCIIKTNKNMI